MKPPASSLNPYAASYIPLSKREAEGRTSVTDKDSKNRDGSSIWFHTPQHIMQDRRLFDSSTYAENKLSTPEAFVVKRQPAYSSSSQNVTKLTDKQLLDEQFDMDMEYLKMTFPGISDQSLADVYMVNRGDLDASIDMLSQLEFDGVESSGCLPETLDIGDVSESVSSVDSSSLKLKNVVAEAGTSSSHMASTNVS